MSGGMSKRAMSHAFNAPPAHPTDSANAAAAGSGQVPVLVRRAEHHRGQPHHRSDRQIDAAADDHRRQRHGEQPQLDAEAGDLEEVSEREEVLRDGREERDLGGERQQQDPLTVREPALAPVRGHDAPAAAVAA